MGVRHSKASVDISTTPKAPEPAVKEAIVTEDGDAVKENNTDVKVEDADMKTKDEAGHLKPELLDVKESRVASLKRNLSFSKLKKMFTKGEGGGTDVESKEGVDDEKEGEAVLDEVRDAKDEAKEEEVAEVPEDRPVAEGEWKVTALKNSLYKMFSRESADTEADAAAASKKEEGIEDGKVEGAAAGLKPEESLEEKTEVVSKVTNLKKRLSFKALKSRFSKEKKEGEAANPEKENEECDAKEEVKNCDNIHTEVVNVASDDGAVEMAPPTEAPPAVPVEPVPDEEVNVKNVLEPKEGGNLGEIETPNAGNDDIAVEGAAESLAAKTS